MPEDILSGKVTDVYFQRTRQILETKGKRAHVVAEFILKKFPDDFKCAGVGFFHGLGGNQRQSHRRARQKIRTQKFFSLQKLWRPPRSSSDCKSGKLRLWRKFESLLVPIVENGKLVYSAPTPQQIRERVLQQLENVQF